MLSDILLDPTFVYLVLMLGMWSAVTAAYVPGTGVSEGLAMILLLAAFTAFAQMSSVRWIAVVFIAIGMLILMLIPFLFLKNNYLGEISIGIQGIGSILLYRDTIPNLIMILVMLVAAFSYYRFLLIPMIKRIRGDPTFTLETKTLVGSNGRVVAPVNPPENGTAHIDGELWSIHCLQPLSHGDRIQVVSVEGLTVYVEPLIESKSKNSDPRPLTQVDPSQTIHESQEE